MNNSRQSSARRSEDRRAFSVQEPNEYRSDLDEHTEPLRLGTDPAGEGTNRLHVRHHRGQGPSGLDEASRDDDGRLRQVEATSTD